MPLQRQPNGLQQRFSVDGLHQKNHRPFIPRVHACENVGVSGQKNDRQGDISRSHHVAQFRPHHPRHAHIQAQEPVISHRFVRGKTKQLPGFPGEPITPGAEIQTPEAGSRRIRRQFKLRRLAFSRFSALSLRLAAALFLLGFALILKLFDDQIIL